MKRHTLTLALLLSVSLTIFGQNHYEANIAGGGKGGVTLSRMNFNPSVPQSMIMGFEAGGQFRYIEEKHFGLIAELNVEQRGWKESFDKGYDYSYSRRFTYVELPVLTHLYFGGEKLHFFINAGPSVGYMIGKSTSSNFDYAHFESIEGFPSTNRQTEQFNLKVKRHFDYGISAGMGLEWFMNHKQSITLEGRFYYGLGDVFPNHKTDNFSSSNAMGLMFTLGYFYRIK